MLRAALRRLGLPRAAGRVKRAIQFGSRIGSLVNRHAPYGFSVTACSKLRLVEASVGETQYYAYLLLSASM